MSVRREIAVHHCVVRTRVVEQGHRPYQLHTLFILEDGKAPEPMVPLMEYVVDIGKLRALAWQRKALQAVGLFVDFAIAYREAIGERAFPEGVRDVRRSTGRRNDRRRGTRCDRTLLGAEVGGLCEDTTTIGDCVSRNGR